MSLLSTVKTYLGINGDEIRALPYDLRYSKLGIQKVIKDIKRIETEIQDDINIVCLNFFEREGAAIQGDYFTFKGEKYRLHLEFLKAERKLYIRLIPLIYHQYTPAHVSVDINGFGGIRSFEFQYPYKLRKNFNVLIDIITNQLHFAYLSIERVFKSSFKTLGDLLFNELYSIVAIEIERTNKKRLLGNVHFAVCLQATKRFRYYLDHENMDVVINHYKKNQVAEFSPFEMLASIVCEEAVHTLNTLLDVQEGEFYNIDSSEYVSQQESIKFWISESLLVDNKELTIFTIVKTGKYILEFGCAKELESEFEPIFKMVKDSLTVKFSENLDKYVDHAKQLAKIPKPGLLPIKLVQLAEFIGVLAGNASASFVKKITKI